MGKPKGEKCDTCEVINNALRCSLCKHAPKEWVFGEEGKAVIGDLDMYKEAESGIYSTISPEVVKMSENLVFELPDGNKVMFRKVVFAHWVDKGGGVAECSNCKKEIKTVASVHNYFAFCPFCGAIVQRGLTA